MKTRATGITIAAAMAAFLAAAGGASAQDALGGGNVLDANPSASGRANFGLPVQDYRARNLLITGNVVGGRGFQGSVGYRAEGDFFSPLGSDDLYSFRASSATSSLEYLNLGRSYDRLMVGQDLGLLEYTPSAAGATGRTVGQRLPSTMTFDRSLDAAIQRAMPTVDAHMRLDRVASSIMSNNLLSADAESDPIGWVYDQDGRRFVATSSSLRGLQYQIPQASPTLIGLSSLDMARTFEDYLSGIHSRPGRPFEWGFSESQQPEIAGPQPPTGSQPLPDTKPETLIQPQAAGQPEAAKPIGYRHIVERVAGRYNAAEPASESSDAAGSIRSLSDQLRAVRREMGAGVAESDSRIPTSMGGLDPAAPFTQEQTDATSVPGSGRGDMPGMDPRAATPSLPILPGLTSPTTTTPSTATSGTGAMPRLPDPITTGPDHAPALQPGMESTEADAVLIPSSLQMRDLSAALRHGQSLAQLAGDDPSRFNELIAGGEQAMRAGEYFNAERRFTQALRYTPNHPLALAGVANAQLGAGLYLSAATTIRSLFTRFPEMIDTRYDAALLPRPDRMEAAVTALRQRAADERVRVNDRSSAALLVAYIGHQTGNRALVAEALGHMASLTPDDPLARLLTGVWMPGKDEGAAKAPPAKAAPPAPASPPSK
jgi:hypothetical protein